MWKLYRSILKGCALLLCSLLPTIAHLAPILHTLQERNIPFQALHGKWVFIPYWASWCDACVQEIQILNQFYQHHQSKVQIFAVNMDHVSAAEQKQLAASFHLAFPSLIQGQNPAFDGSELTAIPAMMIFSPQGDFHSLVYGMQTSKRLQAILSLQGPQKHPTSHDKHLRPRNRVQRAYKYPTPHSHHGPLS